MNADGRAALHAIQSTTMNRSCKLALIGVASACLATQALPQTETLKVRSKAVTVAGERTADIEGRIWMPVNATRSHVLVVVNSSSGKNDPLMAGLAAAAMAAGIAAVTVDTYTPRGVADTVMNPERVSYVEQFEDIFAIVRKLRVDPRFAGRKVALAGHSRAGILSYMAAQSDFNEFFGAEVPSLDAYVALSPDCLPRFPKPALNGPLHIISGEKDDWTQPAPCLRHVRQLVAAGQPASMDLVAGVSHSFSSDGVQASAAIKFACPADGDYFYVRRESQGQAMLVRDSRFAEDETPRAMWKRCAGFMGIRGRGATAGGSRDQMPRAIQMAIDFLKSQGW